MKRTPLMACLIGALLIMVLAVTSSATAQSTSMPTKIGGLELIAHVDAAQHVRGAVEARAPNTWVYITNTGKKYHRKGCRYLKKSKKKIRLKRAKALGYKPCKVCKPPRK